MCKAVTTASKKHFFHYIIFFLPESPKSPLKVPWRSWTLRPLGDLQGTSPRRRVPAGLISHTKITVVKLMIMM